MNFFIYEKFLNFLSLRIKKKIFFSLFLSFIFLFFNLFAFSLLIPFFSSIIDPNIISNIGIISKTKTYFFGKDFSNYNFIIFLGILCFVFINITNLSSLLADNIKFKIIRKIGVELTDKVIKQFLQLNYFNYTKYKKNFLISRVLLDLDSIIIQVVYSSFELISRIFLVFVVGIFLIWLEPLLTLLSAITLITFYYTIYFFSKKKLSSFGKQMTYSNSERVDKISNLYDNFTLIQIWKKNEKFLENLLQPTSVYYHSYTKSEFSKKIPKILVESIFFSIVIGICLFLKTTRVGDSNLIILFSAYAVSAYKLMPSFQMIFFSIYTIKNNYPKFEGLYNDYEFFRLNKKHYGNKKIKSVNDIEIKNLGMVIEKNKLFQNLNCRFKIGDRVAIIGKSGSGKTTLSKIIMGLLNPSSGKIFIDGIDIKLLDQESLCKLFSFCPEKVPLMQTTPRNNILFYNKYYKVMFDKIIRLYNLSFIKKNKFNFKNKINYSSGEVKRLLIARSVYSPNPILIFDEPTANLDNNNRKKIIKNIKEIKNKIIIFLTHDKKLIQISNKQIFLN